MLAHIFQFTLTVAKYLKFNWAGKGRREAEQQGWGSFSGSAKLFRSIVIKIEHHNKADNRSKDIK